MRAADGLQREAAAHAGAAGLLRGHRRGLPTHDLDHLHPPFRVQPVRPALVLQVGAYIGPCQSVTHAQHGAVFLLWRCWGEHSAPSRYKTQLLADPQWWRLLAYGSASCMWHAVQRRANSDPCMGYCLQEHKCWAADPSGCLLRCRQAALTGRDSFVMGPSGYGFLHPGLIAEDSPLLPVIVNATLGAAALLSTSAYVHWDDYGNFVAGVRGPGMRNARRRTSRSDSCMLSVNQTSSNILW